MKKLIVKRSKIHGRGLFVEEPVRRGEFISFLRGKICRLEVQTQRQSLSHACWIGIGKGKWLDPIYLYKHLNHSCNPSAAVRGKITLVAIRDLKPGDEITVDYSLIEGDPFWHMHCGCGEKTCRKMIRSVQFLPPFAFKRYLPFIPTYFRNLYLKYNKV